MTPKFEVVIFCGGLTEKLILHDPASVELPPHRRPRLGQREGIYVLTRF